MAGFFCSTVAQLLLVLMLRGAAARVEIITDNPSPFAAVDPDAPKFVVTVFDDAAKAPQPPPASRFELMTSADGRRYNCTLPPLPGAAGAGQAVGATAVAATTIGAASPAAPGKSPFDLLDPLTAICLYHKDATWTYESCHRNRVRQFRQVSGTKTEEFSCGAYKGDEAQSETILEDTSASGRPVKYVVHRYINGATCHLTGQPRTAEVRYTCLRDSKENLIASVREFPTCNYVVLVSTPLLCQHPAFRPKPEDSRLISCVPLGGAGQGQAEAEAFDSSGKGSGGGGSSGIGGDAEPVADKAAATAGAAASASQQDQQQAAAARPSPEAAAGVDGGGLQAGGAVDGGSKGGGGAAEAGAMGRDEL